MSVCFCVCVSVVLAQRWAGAMFGPMAAAPDVKDCSTHPKEEEEEEDEEESAAGLRGRRDRCREIET